MRFDDKISHASAKKKTKRLKGFQILHFLWSFSSDIMAVMGLKLDIIVLCMLFYVHTFNN